MIEIVPATFRDVTYVLANLREKDRQEVYATAGEVNTVDLAMILIGGFSLPFIARMRGNPECVFGVTQTNGFGNVWSGWAVGTDRMRRTIPAVTRHCLDVIKPQLLEWGATRLQVHTLADHDLSHEWLKSMGASFEGVARGWGVHGDDFHVYAWARRL